MCIYCSSRMYMCTHKHNQYNARGLETGKKTRAYAPLDVEAVDVVLPLAPPRAAEDDDVLRVLICLFGGVGACVCV